MRPTFTERLSARMQEVGSRLCVGLDPVIDRFPSALQELDAEEALTAFCGQVLEAVGDTVAAVKPQAAFFEQHGWRGMRALENVCRMVAEQGIPVVLDAKRGDIGSTAAAYARAYLDNEGIGRYVDALTVNPYLGSDAMGPFLEAAAQHGRGLFVLARTSNPGGAEFQTFRDDAGPLYEGVARAAECWNDGHVAAGYGPVGLVAGATYPEELARIRELAPSSVLLLPGIGAQGGKVEDILAAFDEDGLGGLVSSSRGVIYAYGDPSASDWQSAVAGAARTTRESIEAALAARCK